jgi:hypothetical protein
MILMESEFLKNNLFFDIWYYHKKCIGKHFLVFDLFEFPKHIRNKNDKCKIFRES